MNDFDKVLKEKLEKEYKKFYTKGLLVGWKQSMEIVYEKLNNVRSDDDFKKLKEFVDKSKSTKTINTLRRQIK